MPTFYTLFLIDGTASGLSADDLKASVDSLKLLAESCDADIVLLREKPAEEGNVAEYLVRNRADENDFMEVRLDPLGTHMVVESPCVSKVP